MLLRDILPMFVPYALTLALFCVFVFWNGGIVLGTYGALGSLCRGPVYWIGLMFFQGTSQITCRRFTYHSCIILLRLQRSWGGQR